MELLKKGDKVFLFAPARKVVPTEMQAFINEIESWGLEVEMGKHLYAADNQFAGTDEERAADLTYAWNNPEIKAIFCARGGYGSMRMLDHLKMDYRHPKWLIGYSDVSTLHLHLQKHNISSIHGPMGLNGQKLDREITKQNFNYLRTALFEGLIEYSTEEMGIINGQPFSGKLTGGNLSLIYASLGTPEMPDTQNRVLFIEEIDEYFYAIDRMVCSLKRAGIFDGITALILGEFCDIKDNEKPFGKSVLEIFLAHLPNPQIPVIFDFPAGHGEKNFCMGMNVDCTFDGKFFKQRIH